MSVRHPDATSMLTFDHHVDDLCRIPPSPELRDRLNREFAELRDSAGPFFGPRIQPRVEPNRVGFNDGLIFPGTYLPIGTTARIARRTALERAPLRGTVRVIVVLVDFSDKQMSADAVDRFRDLFFSTSVLPHGSVKEYFTDVSGSLISLDGEVVGPYRLPQTIATYAGSENGTQGATPNARTMAHDAVSAADPDVTFAPYDNDGNGYVDAFVVVHAGSGAEETGAATDIWSHKWVLPAERTVDSTKVYGYLTIPEDARVGVCAHELGHLLFGWPDLYDTDGTSEGVGNWCLMAGGSWGLSGDRPTHPSAWCKVSQGWANVVNHTANALVAVEDVKISRNVHRLWKDGAGGNEYFLIENRQQSGYDASMPGQGLLIWHVDDAVSTNSDERHYKVALMQADGRRDLETNANRGDAGDAYPGSGGNTSFTDSSLPSSKSYAGSSTCVSVTDIPTTAPTMQVRLGVRCFVKPLKDVKEGGKEGVKEVRDKPLKDQREGKPLKDLREGKPLKDVRDKRGQKELGPKELGGKELAQKESGGKELGPKENKDIREFPGGKLVEGPGGGGFPSSPDPVDDVSARLAALELMLAALLTGGRVEAPDWTGAAPAPFIGAAERPDLAHSALYDEEDLAEVRAAMQAGSAEAKRYYDSLPPS